MTGDDYINAAPGMGSLTASTAITADELVAECSAGPTPKGGAYSIARYLDADGPGVWGRHKD